MKKQFLLLFISLLLHSALFSQQYKRNMNWSVGYEPGIKFNFNQGLAIAPMQNNNSTPPYCLMKNSSAISDTNGKLLFFTNGFAAYDSNGYVMPNGLYINSPLGTAYSSLHGVGTFDQTSIILPKKNNSYYVFSTGISDSIANPWLNFVGPLQFDVFNYSVVDMDSNGGLGKVTLKNKILLDNQNYGNCALTAVRHGNNKDWWLVKADAVHHQYQSFWVKEDTVLGPYYYNIIDTGNFHYDNYSQIYFSEDGTKFASSIIRKFYPGTQFNEYNRVDVYDFNRNTGQFTFKNYYKTPADTTTYPNEDGEVGICFSPDSKLLYMSTLYSIYQIEIQDTDKNNAIYIHGPDTTLDVFPMYHLMAYGPNGKLYIGNFNATQKYMSYIDKPNVRGLGCNFKAHGVWQSYTNISNPPNMPSYGLGQYGTVPLSLPNPPQEVEEGEVEIYPNPSSTMFVVKASPTLQRREVEMYNSIGQLVIKNPPLEGREAVINVSHLPKGLYYIKVGNMCKKVVVE